MHRTAGSGASLRLADPGSRAARLIPAVIFFFLALALTAPAQEVQRHGLVFEAWIDDTFFGGYRPPGYTQKWDIPASANRDHGGVPVNPKAAKYRTPVDLGDALRQFDIAEPFILVIGYWRQDGDAKRIVNIVAPRIDPAAWRKLWGPVTRADLERLDAVVKDKSLTPAQARAAAKKIKHAAPFNDPAAIIEVNPKIDSHMQRRLQCSLRFADVFKFLAPGADPTEQAHPTLWGVEFPAAIVSKPREFAR
ncbi:MAG TPA: hypothetical protein VG710_11855 [Opitutus sp.]|nr:hypothetical protein [Opitutus sp.]